MDDKTPRRTFRRRLVRALIGLLAVGAIGVASLPWLLSTTPARVAIVAAINREIAPSRVDLGGLSLSWAGSIRLSGLTLRDGRGKVLVEAMRADLDRGLLALLRERHDLGTLTIDGAAVDLERRPDGSINLVDALSGPGQSPSSTPPPPTPTPTPTPTRPTGSPSRMAVTLKIVQGSLRLSSPELAEPLVADRMELEVRLPAEPGRRLVAKVRLAKPPGGSDAETLSLDAEFDHRAPGTPDLALTVKGERWPLALSSGGVAARGRLDGAVSVARKGGHWESSGAAKVLDLDASGTALAGDRLRLDAVGGAWDLAETAESWTVRRLAFQSPVAELHASGSIAPDGRSPAAKVEGRVDLAALARQVPHTLRLREGLALERGSAHLTIDVTSSGGAQQGVIEARISDLVARDPAKSFTLRDPATLKARASRTLTGFGVESLELKTAFLDLNGSGDLDRGVKLDGTIDLGGLESQFRDLIDFGALQLAGRGRLAADYRKAGPGFVGRYAAEVRGVRVAGLTDEPVVRDSVRIDAVAKGPVDASGLPRAWADLRASYKSSRDAVALSAQDRDGTMSLRASASVPVPVSGREGQAEIKFAGRWLPEIVEIDELRLGLRPADPALAAAGSLAFAARGRVAYVAENLILTPLPVPTGTALTLAPEGMWLHGLGRTPLTARAGRIPLVGDLAAIDRALAAWTGEAPYGLAGSLATQIDLGPGEAGRLKLGLTAAVPDLSRAGADGRSRTAEGALNLMFLGTYRPEGDRLDCGVLKLDTRYGTAAVAGRLDDPAGRRLADLQGALVPNWETLTAVAAEAIEPKARLRGGARPFRVKGPLSGGSLVAILKGLDAEVGLDLASADVLGLKLGPAPLVIRCGGGNVAIDPIRTTLNGGRVDLKPGLALDESRGAIALQLASGSTIDGAEIDDEVSRDLLRYVAPVLDEATHVHGHVAVAVDRADFPITGPPGRSTTLTGQVVFQDVVFAPGPFAGQLLGLVGRPDAAGLKLQQPVQLSIADGRVSQKGLEVPVRRDAKIALEGSVGFDQSLDLRASVPITRGMLGRDSGLDEIAGDSRVTVPIGGTVSHPQINRQALQVALRNLSKDVLKRELSRKASGLLDQVAPPDSPSASPDRLKNLEGDLLRRVLPRPRSRIPSSPPADDLP